MGGKVVPLYFKRQRGRRRPSSSVRKNKLFLTEKAQALKDKNDPAYYDYLNDLSVDLRLKVNGNKLRLETPDWSGDLAVGEWSKPVTFSFKFNPFLTIEGYGKFYLLELQPDVKLYLQPLSFHPKTMVVARGPGAHLDAAEPHRRPLRQVRPFQDPRLGVGHLGSQRAAHTRGGLSRGHARVRRPVPADDDGISQGRRAALRAGIQFHRPRRAHVLAPPRPEASALQAEKAAKYSASHPRGVPDDGRDSRRRHEEAAAGCVALRPVGPRVPLVQKRVQLQHVARAERLHPEQTRLVEHVEV